MYMDQLYPLLYGFNGYAHIGYLIKVAHANEDDEGIEKTHTFQEY